MQKKKIENSSWNRTIDCHRTIAIQFCCLSYTVKVFRQMESKFLRIHAEFTNYWSFPLHIMLFIVNDDFLLNTMVNQQFIYSQDSFVTDKVLIISICVCSVAGSQFLAKWTLAPPSRQCFVCYLWSKWKTTLSWANLINPIEQGLQNLAKNLRNTRHFVWAA